ncbi:MAG: VOC family protein [Planctomycetota bacterium]
MMRRLHHVGVAVPNLDAAVQRWRGLLQQEPVIEDVPGQEVRTARFPCGVELLAPLAPDSPISKFLDRQGGGVHHVTLEVQDVDAELGRLAAAGVQLLHDHAVPGAGGSWIAFVHPRATGGVLLELVQHG